MKADLFEQIQQLKKIILPGNYIVFKSDPLIPHAKSYAYIVKIVTFGSLGPFGSFQKTP